MSNDLRKFYQTSKDYRRELKSHDQESFQLFSSIVGDHVVRGARVLDIGCGTGLSSFLFGQSGYRAVGFDWTEGFIERQLQAEKIAGSLDYVVGDAGSLPFQQETFDAVVSYAFIEHVADVSKVFLEMLRVLKRSGKLVVIAPNLLSPYKPLENLRKLLKGKSGHTLWGKNAKCMSFLLIIKNILLTLLKLVQLRARFEYRQPILDPVEPDNDRTWQANPIDIRRFLVSHGCRLLRYQAPKRKITWLNHFGPMTQIVAEKA